MMATMAALLGAVPLVIATGPGSELRRRSLRIIEIGGITNVLLLERNKPRDGPDSQSLGIGYSWIGQFQSRSRAPSGWASATIASVRAFSTKVCLAGGQIWK